MSDSFKRTLTNDSQVVSANQSSFFNRTDTSPELTAQLRNVGARVRKSVTEGYITPPTSRAFTKAQSTMTIFSSAKDINREVFGSNIIPIPSDPANPHKKRSRSADRSSDVEQDDDQAMNNDVSTNSSSSQPIENRSDRATRPLRKHRPLMATRSLPVEAFRFSHQSSTPATAMPPTTEADEDDWSVQPTINSDHSTFEPVVFD